jgi:hypothetical protein
MIRLFAILIWDDDIIKWVFGIMVCDFAITI